MPKGVHDYRHELGAIADESARLDRLCEISVMRQVRNVASDVFVREAWKRGQSLAVHGWVYSLANGLVNDLGVTVSRPEEIERLRYSALLARAKVADPSAS